MILASTSAVPDQWSRDGRFLVYSSLDPKTNLDLWVLPVDKGAPNSWKPIVFLQTEFNENQGQLSPDSRWMAYSSDESGQREIYVRPFPPGDGKWKISNAGGEQPRWRGDGKELFYSAPDGQLFAVPIKAMTGGKQALEPGVPESLFNSHIIRGSAVNGFQYDVTADGQRFLVISVGASGVSSPPLTVVVNWTTGLKR